MIPENEKSDLSEFSRSSRSRSPRATLSTTRHRSRSTTRRRSRSTTRRRSRSTTRYRSRSTIRRRSRSNTRHRSRSNTRHRSRSNTRHRSRSNTRHRTHSRSTKHRTHSRSTRHRTHSRSPRAARSRSRNNRYPEDSRERSTTRRNPSRTSVPPQGQEAQAQSYQELRNMISEVVQLSGRLGFQQQSTGRASQTSKIFKKTLHDEVVQIYSNLDSSLHFDLSTTFSSQKKRINKKLLPVIKSAMNPAMQAYDTEILSVIKQLHKSRRETWKNKRDGRSEERTKGQHVSSRRKQKMDRRAKGLQHMILTEDTILDQCRPRDISRDEYILNCEQAINFPDLHSDEISSDDETLALEERTSGQRPENIKNTSSVIKVQDKKWRSGRIKKILHHAEEIAISIGTGLTRIRHRSDNYVDVTSRPNENIPSWWLSSKWVPPPSDDESEEDYSNEHDVEDGNNVNDSNKDNNRDEDKDEGNHNRDEDKDEDHDKDKDNNNNN